ncbi:sensor histidine kinase [Amycolatopsis sp. MtRt-6]|uniref:sensor histidine kinase n=1 Tax=Amycolatopsis sp. MtRt-6 TaxID=2792782 RepID=UPI001A8C073B|nr:histidine kinase [Amycolatopsis sp. MtRt-6]
MTASWVEKCEARWNRLGPRRRELLLDAAAVLVWGGLTIALSPDAETRWWAAGAAALLVARRRTPSAVLAGVMSIQLLTVGDVFLALWCAAYTVGARGRAVPGVLGVAAASLAYVVLAWDPADLVDGASDAGFQILFPALLGVCVRRFRQQAALHRERAVTQERDRIAREMHDVLGHKLSLISLQAGRLELGGKADARTAELLGATSREAMQSLREIIGVLDADPRPKSVPDLVECSRLTGMRIESRVDDRMASLPKTLSDAAYRIVQEALTNVHKHAGPVDVEVECQVAPDRVRLLVRNGPGARPPATHGVGTGRGLRSLTAQIRTLGGHLSYGPTGDGGFAVHAVLATRAGNA